MVGFDPLTKRRITMQAFHNKQDIKDLYVNRVLAHQKADEFIQSWWFEDGKGCSLGCTLNYNNDIVNDCIFKRYEKELNIPENLARLHESIFESLPVENSKTFPHDFLNAIPVGADLSQVVDKFNLWLLKDKKHGVYQYADAQGKKAINQVAKLLRRKLAGIKVCKSTWQNAADAAAYAAADAAYAAYAAAYAAYAASYAAADAAADAPADAAYAAADAAKHRNRVPQAKKLIELVGE